MISDALNDGVEMNSTGNSSYYGVESGVRSFNDGGDEVKASKFWNRKTILSFSKQHDNDNRISKNKRSCIGYIDIPFLGRFEFAPGVKEGNGWGIYGYQSKLLTYNGGMVRHYLAPFLTPELTVCNYWYVWLQHTCYNMYAISLMCIIALGFHSSAFPDTEFGGGSVCEDADDVEIKYNKSICQLEVVLDDARSEFRFLIAFVLAGYVAAAVNTWNTRRKLYATLCGRTRALMLLISSSLPIPSDTDATKDDLIKLRQTLNRWAMLANELATLKAQGLIETDDARNYLERKQMLQGDEWDSTVPGDRHTTVFFWLATKINQLDASILDKHLNYNIIEGITDMRGAANDMMDCICTDHPYPYVALCGLLVKLNVLLMSTWNGVRWSIWYWSFGHYIWLEPKMWVDLFVLFTWNISYVCLYDLGYLLYNPFKDRRIDLAHEAITTGLLKLGIELGTGTSRCLPSTITFDAKKMV